MNFKRVLPTYRVELIFQRKNIGCILGDSRFEYVALDLMRALVYVAVIMNSTRILAIEKKVKKSRRLFKSCNS